MRVSAVVLLGLPSLFGCQRERAPGASGARLMPSATIQMPRQSSSSAAPKVVPPSSVVPRPVPAQLFAFGKGAVLWLGDDEAVAHSLRDGGVLARWSVARGRHVVTLADGSLLVVSNERTDHWQRGHDRPRVFARVPDFAETMLFGDRARADTFWLHPGFGPTLYRFELAEGAEPILQIQQSLAAEGFERGMFSSLRDGSFLYWAGGRVRRFFPGGRTSDVRVPAELRPWRVLPSDRLDRSWLVGERGELFLVELGRELRQLESRELGRVPFDAAGTSRELSIVTLAPTPGASDFMLELFDAKGRKRLSVEPPWDEPVRSTTDAALPVSENQNVALSEFDALVAVGGPGRLCVWRTENGERLWCVERPPRARTGPVAGSGGAPPAAEPAPPL